MQPPPPVADGKDMPRFPQRPPAVRDAAPRPGELLWDRMSEAERDRFRQFLAEHFPDRFDELTELEAHDPPQFRMFIGRILPEMRRLRELHARDPELFEIRKQEMEAEFQLRRLARRYRFAKEENKPALEKEIRALVEKHFDLRTQREDQELARLERRLEQLRKRSESRATDRDRMIEEIVADVLAGRPPRPGADRPREGDRPGEGGRRGGAPPREGERAGDGDRPGDQVDQPSDGEGPDEGRPRARRPRAGDRDGDADRPPRERRPHRRRANAPKASPAPMTPEDAPSPADRDEE